jgi:NhaP-type Na+/H+ or K+/H+ antiporter
LADLLATVLSAESGVNDGAAFPFLFLALYLILETDDRVAIGEWFYITWLCGYVTCPLISPLIGQQMKLLWESLSAL